MKSTRKMIDIAKASTQIYELGEALNGKTLKQIRIIVWHYAGVKLGWETLTKLCYLHGVKIRWNSKQRTQEQEYYQLANTILR
jgi:hypothetical protein